MNKLTKKQKRKLYLIIGTIFVLFYYFKDRPRIHSVQVDQQPVNYKTPAKISEKTPFRLSFELEAPSHIRSYSVTIYNKKRYNPNIKNIEEEDGLRGRKTFYNPSPSVTIDYFTQSLKEKEYQAEILVTDGQGYQTRSTFLLQVN